MRLGKELVHKPPRSRRSSSCRGYLRAAHGRGLVDLGRLTRPSEPAAVEEARPQVVAALALPGWPLGGSPPPAALPAPESLRSRRQGPGAGDAQ